MKTLTTVDLIRKKFIGTDDLRKDLTNILNTLPEEGEVVITQRGKPQAILLNIEAYIELQEQLADSDPKLIESLNKALADAKKGNVIPADQVFKELGV